MPKNCDEFSVNTCPCEIAARECPCHTCYKESACGLCPEYGYDNYPIKNEYEDLASAEINNPNDGKWSYNFTEDGLWDNDTFGTKQEAIEAGVEAALEENEEVFYVGQLDVVKLSTDSIIDHDDVLQSLGDQLDENYDSVDLEHSEKWYQAIKPENKELLQEMLDKTIGKWINETGNYPKTFTIINISEHQKWNDWAENMSLSMAKEFSSKLTEEMLKP